MIVDKALRFAANAHKGQTRKYTGLPYIVHPIEVMSIVSEYDQRESMLAAALLHDVLEDTNTHPLTIRIEFGDEVLALVQGMTKVDVPGNRAARKAAERDRLSQESTDVQTIKYADIVSNSRRIALDDPEFAAKYLAEQKLLLSVIKKGNQSLAFRARDVVQMQVNYLAGGSCAIR